ncbi:unnamed protein product [Mesocestoides corti]|uniref:MFS transporter n=1 Tax=Mesocestoides corti TaxID=53468 RepID=A0A0R3URI6_MESCO|nr:unnamed protein product [Mesocestoides corti]
MSQLPTPTPLHSPPPGEQAITRAECGYVAAAVNSFAQVGVGSAVLLFALRTPPPHPPLFAVVVYAFDASAESVRVRVWCVVVVAPLRVHVNRSSQ